MGCVPFVFLPGLFLYRSVHTLEKLLEDSTDVGWLFCTGLLEKDTLEIGEVFAFFSSDDPFRQVCLIADEHDYDVRVSLFLNIL